MGWIGSHRPLYTVKQWFFIILYSILKYDVWFWLITVIPIPDCLACYARVRAPKTIIINICMFAANSNASMIYTSVPILPIVDIYNNNRNKIKLEMNTFNKITKKNWKRKNEIKTNIYCELRLPHGKNQNQTPFFLSIFRFLTLYFYGLQKNVSYIWEWQFIDFTSREKLEHYENRLIVWYSYMHFVGIWKIKSFKVKIFIIKFHIKLLFCSIL